MLLLQLNYTQNIPHYVHGQVELSLCIACENVINNLIKYTNGHYDPEIFYLFQSSHPLTSTPRPWPYE